MTWRVFLWDPKGADPARMAYYRIASDVPFGAAPDGARATARRDAVGRPAGTSPSPTAVGSMKMLGQLMDYHVSYADPRGQVQHRVRAPQHPPTAPLHARRGAVRRQPAHRSVGPPHRRSRARRRTNHARLLLRARPHLGPAQPTPLPRGPTGDRRPRARVANPGGPPWREIERERGRGRIQYVFGHAWDDSGCDTGFLSFVRTQDGTADGLFAAQHGMAAARRKVRATRTPPGAG